MVLFTEISEYLLPKLMPQDLLNLLNLLNMTVSVEFRKIYSKA